ncbi:MAG TPA: hypothetical protein VFV07_02870 [Rhizomicrobium sp.]|nr:hypothetical protein [Rhizomicrobium sp.]
MEFRERRAFAPVRDDLAVRAASLRMEADFLRARAEAADEDAVRTAYLALAERWLAFAAGLEAELVAALME